MAVWILRRIGKAIRCFLDGWGLVEACRALGLTSLPATVKSFGGWVCSLISVVVSFCLGIVAATALGSLMHAVIA